MMKKYWIFIPMFFFALASTGLSINLHYCHDQLAGIYLSYDISCCCDQDDTEKGCCENQNITVSQVDFDIVLNKEYTLEFKNSSFPPTPLHIRSNSVSQELIPPPHSLEPPPLSKKNTNLYLLFQRLTYYG